MTEEPVRAFLDGLSTRDRDRIGAEVLAGLRDDGPAPPRSFDAVDAGIRQTLAVSGVQVPAGIRVGELPHGSVHALAGGTLVLLDPGLRPLLDRVAGTLVTAQLTPADAGQQRQQRADADTAYAAAVTDWLGRVPAGAAPQNAFGFLMARSAERFALGHEYGHLLAGHRHRPPDGDPRTARQEYEADELAARLILRGLDDGAEFRWRALAVAGPFLLLAVEHLADRIRGTATATHQPPAARTVLLRGIFEEAGARGLLHFAEAWVSSLVLREECIVARAGSGPQVRSQQSEIGG